MPKRLLCRAAQVNPESILRVDLPDGLSIAVYNLGGSYYATDNFCTHGDASLAEGILEGGNVMCPFHGGTFDVRTGEATAPPCIVALRTYRVSIDHGQIFAEVE